jgi:hypothetical protein
MSLLGKIGREIGEEVAKGLAKSAKASKTKKIYRGVEVSKKTKVIKDDAPIGKHWSYDDKVAKSFTGTPKSPNYDKKNVLIEAEVDTKDILKGKKAKEVLESRNYRKQENEVPIKPGAKVKVTKIISTNTRKSGEKIKVTAETKKKYSPFLDDAKIGSYVQINPVVKSRRRTRRYSNGKELSIDNE